MKINTIKATTYVKKDKIEENEIKIHENFRLFLTTSNEKSFFLLLNQIYQIDLKSVQSIDCKKMIKFGAKND